MTQRRAAGLAGRLLLAQSIVAIVAAVTLWLVALAVGPPLFHSHLHQAQVHLSGAVTDHVEEAFRSASVISIGVALLASLIVGTVVSAYVARRIADPIARLSAAARQIAAGRTNVRVNEPALSSEFAGLTDSFNSMAAQLEAVERTRRRLLADLAHETRTPVSTIDAYLQGIEDGVVEVDAETITLLRAQTARLARLAEDITSVSEAEEHRLDLHPRRVDLAAVVDAAVHTASERYRAKRVALTTQIDRPLPPAVVDPDRVGQVLGNLLDNALRHTPAGGAVTVTAVRSGDGIRVRVADTGEGIAAEHLPHLFERFYRADRARDRAHGGSGIGLAIAKALVDAHGGTITATSAGPGRGATFEFSVPAL